jgi:hypothetical protein
MTQAKGIKSKIGYMVETAFATMPTTPALKMLYFISETIGEKMNLNTSKVLRDNRNAIAPVRGNRDVSGGFQTELAPQLGTLLYAALGSKQTTNVSPYYAHVLTVGDLPSMIFEKGFTDLDRYLLFLGCKVSRLSIAVKPEGIQDVSFDLMGGYEAQILNYKTVLGAFTAGLILSGAGSGHTALIKAANSVSPGGFLTLINPSGEFTDEEALTDTGTGSASADGTLGDASIDGIYDDPGHNAFDGFSLSTIQEGGVDIAYLTGVDIVIENNLDGGNYALGGGGIRRSLPEGLVKVSGTMTALFESMAMYMKALNKTESSLKIGFKNGTGAGTEGNETMEIYVPELIISKETPLIEGPQGLLYKGPFEAYYGNSAEESSIQITINNAEATI